MTKINVTLTILIFSAGIAFVILFELALDYSNETEFCVSCHSMQTSYEAYKNSVHYKNASGIVATCADCHAPKPFFPKMKVKVLAGKDLYHEIAGTIDTKEKYEAHYEKMANRVWDYMRETNSRECRSCHEISQMNQQQQSEEAREEHAMLADGETACIDCHTGVGHSKP